MSFLNHMGLGFLDPENNLDKLANSIKGGDVSKLVETLKSIFTDLEERLESFTKILERETNDAKRGMRQTSRRMIRAEVAKGQKDLEALQEEFGDKLMDQVMEQLKPTVSIMVATEVKKRVEADKAKE